MAATNCTGLFLLILGSSHNSFTVSFDGGQAVPAAAGLQIPSDNQFSLISFNDLSGGGLSVVSTCPGWCPS